MMYFVLSGSLNLNSVSMSESRMTLMHITSVAPTTQVCTDCIVVYNIITTYIVPTGLKDHRLFVYLSVCVSVNRAKRVITFTKD